MDLLSPLTAYDFQQCDQSLSETYSDQIASLAQFTDEPHQAFLKFHTANIKLFGKGPLLDTMKAKLTENGATHLSWVLGRDLRG